MGNSIMMHLLLGLPAESIRLSPFVTAVNHLPTLTAAEIGLDIHPEAEVICLPGGGQLRGRRHHRWRAFVWAGRYGTDKPVHGHWHQRRNCAGLPRLAGNLCLFGWACLRRRGRS
ncbi:MAG: hypothetical protein H6656_01230 [Ardenticatenaceae bacterium]|nr:hypothetical protein [Ardenticatenaceae bacterium]